MQVMLYCNTCHPQEMLMTDEDVPKEDWNRLFAGPVTAMITLMVFNFLLRNYNE